MHKMQEMGLELGYAMKQIIVIRKDLGMTAGKMVAQGAHASMVAVLDNPDDDRVKEWLMNSFTKICVRIESEDDLLDIYEKAKGAGLIAALITDNGKTMFHGVPTHTAVAVGPDTDENIDPVTGHLKLL